MSDDPTQSDAAIAELLAAVREPGRFDVTAPRPGVIVGRYVVPATARNSEVDALADLADAAEGIGLHAVVWRDKRGPFVEVTSQSLSQALAAEPHDPQCECDACCPDVCDPIERDAGCEKARAA